MGPRRVLEKVDIEIPLVTPLPIASLLSPFPIPSRFSYFHVFLPLSFFYIWLHHLRTCYPFFLFDLNPSLCFFYSVSSFSSLPVFSRFGISLLCFLSLCPFCSLLIPYLSSTSYSHFPAHTLPLPSLFPISSSFISPCLSLTFLSHALPVSLLSVFFWQSFSFFSLFLFPSFSSHTSLSSSSLLSCKKILLTLLITFSCLVSLSSSPSSLTTHLRLFSVWPPWSKCPNITAALRYDSSIEPPFLSCSPSWPRPMWL